MERHCGDPRFPLWLLGDSNPRNWAGALDAPLDARHPARHNIWTAVLDGVQDRVYRARRIRLETSWLFIRNAVGDVTDKPHGSDVVWPEAAKRELVDFERLISLYRPFLVLSFGAFAYEFARRALGDRPDERFKNWTSLRLGAELRDRSKQLATGRTNVFPLLHASIARGHFIKSHSNFCAANGSNYFEHAADVVADVLLAHGDALRIWIEGLPERLKSATDPRDRTV